MPRRPVAVFGDYGWMGGGAAGFELDRARALGTPPHALVIGRAVLDDPTYQPVNEERYDHTWPAAREEIIRSDLTFFETGGGGAVFRRLDEFHRRAAGRRLRQCGGPAGHQHCHGASLNSTPFPVPAMAP